MSAETEPGLSAFLGKSNLRQRSALCTKNATYMAKMEFNTGIETLTIFSFPLWQLCTGELCSHYGGSPAVTAAELGPADVRE